MKMAWLTDIHLNFLSADGRLTFYSSINQSDCDAVLISGDIAEAPSIASIMIDMAEAVGKSIYFVLGNHDYYSGDVDTVRNEMNTLSQNQPLLHWLPACGVQPIAEDVMLLGQDGWADGRYGDYNNSRVALNDSRLIADLYSQAVMGKQNLLEKMQQLADFDAKQLKNDLQTAVKQQPKKIIVLTHIPPFIEVCMYEGKISDDNFLPFFSSKATGDVLLKLAKEYPSIDIMVLCGHTHSEGLHQPLDNLLVKSGKAEYYKPIIQDVFVVP